jgi:hypothetical protein
MSFFNLYAKTVRDAQLGSPALSTDITDGFFGYSLLAGCHSIKGETVYANIAGCLVVDDSVWEVYESKTDDPVFCHRETGRTYNALTDFVVTRGNDTFRIELVGAGKIESNSRTIGLMIRDGINLRAQNITEFAS